MVEIGRTYLFLRPARANIGLYTYSTWYGTNRLNQYNDSRVFGKVLKINRKSITIQNDDKTAWNYGHTYKVPKDAEFTAL